MSGNPLQQRHSASLIYLGVLLFLLGLIVGLAVPFFANPRMGLSSHIEGVLNGMFLIILGLVWHRIDLPDRWLKMTYWLALYGTFANWFSMLAAALFNAGGMLTVAAEGRKGHPAAEGLVTFLLVTLTIAMITVCVALLTGLRRSMKKAM